MPDSIDLALPAIAWDEVAVAAALLGIAILAALVLHRLLFAIASRLTHLTSGDIDDTVLDTLYRPVRLAMLGIAVAAVARFDPNIGAVWDKVSIFLVPAIVGLMVLSISRAIAGAMLLKAEHADDPVAARSRKTRVLIVSRTISGVIIVITVGWVLLGVPGVRDIGVTLMASAGLAALAVGAAAQPALKSLIAGLQMAITEPVRIGDLVVIDGHTGRVEEIRMSFITVRTWDERAIIVPTADLLDSSFENWSRKSEELTGAVFLHLDPATQVGPIRAEFLRFVETQDLWDHRTAALLMTEAHPESIELRISVSSSTIGDLFALRCAVREHMVGWLGAEMPDALIRHRLEVESANERVKGK